MLDITYTLSELLLAKHTFMVTGGHCMFRRISVRIDKTLRVTIKPSRRAIDRANERELSAPPVVTPQHFISCSMPEWRSPLLTHAAKWLALFFPPTVEEKK